MSSKNNDVTEVTEMRELSPHAGAHARTYA
jgi:hypothetical protein